MKHAIAHFLQTVVCTDTVSNIVAVAAGVCIIFVGRDAMQHGRDTHLSGFASDAGKPEDIPASNTGLSMLLMLMLLPSTPVFGGGRDLVFRSEAVVASVPPEWHPLATSGLSAVWYILLFSLRIAAPPAVSWVGALVLISSSLRLVNSFEV